MSSTIGRPGTDAARAVSVHFRMVSVALPIIAPPICCIGWNMAMAGGFGQRRAPFHGLACPTANA
jgi:hypothetical protein